MGKARPGAGLDGLRQAAASADDRASLAFVERLAAAAAPFVAALAADAIAPAALLAAHIDFMEWLASPANR